MKYLYNILVIFSMVVSDSSNAQSPETHYDFDIDTVDISGNDRHLNKVGSPPPARITENCMTYASFNGANYYNLNNPIYNYSSNEVTVSFWMRTLTPYNDSKIMGHSNVASEETRGYSIGLQGNKIEATFYSISGDPFTLISIEDVPSEEWVHVSVIYYGEGVATMKIYLNGQISNEGLDFDHAWFKPSSDPLRIGNGINNNSPYTGDLDDVRIYYEALSNEQIATLASNDRICPMSGNPIYVDSASTSGAKNGLTWDDAFTELQDAIDLSCNCDNADVWMARGTYNPSQTHDVNNDEVLEERERTFFISEPIKIYGGFQGFESHLNNRPSYTRPGYHTILTGALANGADTAYHVLYMSRATINEEYVLDRLTIRDGRADAMNTNNSSGGGLLIHASGVNLPMISNCRFINNRAIGNGGAISASGQGVSLQLINCVFFNNQSTNNGGALELNGLSAGVKMFNNTLINNTAMNGGACYMTSSLGTPNIEIMNSIFWNNEATNNGNDVFSSKGGTSVKIGNSITSNKGIFIGDNMDIDTTMNLLHDDPMLDFDLIPISGSPAIDAGDNTLVQSVSDITGLPRIRNTVDMGAYEYGDICDQSLKFLSPAVFDAYTNIIPTNNDIEVSSLIKNNSNVFFSMIEGMMFLPDFEVEKGSSVIVILDGCDL